MACEPNELTSIDWPGYCKDSGLNHYELYYIYNQWCQRLDAKFAAFLVMAKKGPKALWNTVVMRNFSYQINVQNYRYWFDNISGILKRAQLLEKVLAKSAAGEDNKCIGRFGHTARTIAIGGKYFQTGSLAIECWSGTRMLESSYEMHDQITPYVQDEGFSSRMTAHQTRSQFEFLGFNKNYAEYQLDPHRGIIGDLIEACGWHEPVGRGINTLGFCMLPDIAYLYNSQGELYMDLMSKISVEVGFGVERVSLSANRTVSGTGTSYEEADAAPEDTLLVTNLTNYGFNSKAVDLLGKGFIEKEASDDKYKYKGELHDLFCAEAEGEEPGWAYGYQEAVPSVVDYEENIDVADGCNQPMDINNFPTDPIQYSTIADECEAEQTYYPDFEKEYEQGPFEIDDKISYKIKEIEMPETEPDKVE